MAGLRTSPLLVSTLLSIGMLFPALAAAQTQHAYPRLVIDNFRNIDFLLDSLSDEANRIGLSSHGLRTLAHVRLRMSGIDVSQRSDRAAIYLNVDVKGPVYHVRISMLRPTSYIVHGEARNTLSETWYDETMGTHDGNRKELEAGILRMLNRFLEEYVRINNEYRPGR